MRLVSKSFPVRIFFLLLLTISIGCFPDEVLTAFAQSSEPTLVFTVTNGENLSSIYTANHETKSTQKLSPDGSDDTLPSWSPDGSKIAFIHKENNRKSINIMDFDGSNAQSLFASDRDITSLAWLPNGNFLSFSVPNTDDDNTSISIIDIKNPSQRILSDSGVGRFPCMSWSPDSSKMASIIATTQKSASGIITKAQGIYVLDLASNKWQFVADHTNTQDLACPSWSPDGKIIGYLDAPAGGPPFLYTLAADSPGGSSTRLLDSGAGQFCIVWSPDSKYIALRSSRSDTEIAVVEVANSKYYNVAKRTSGGLLGGNPCPAWSPDEKYLAFLNGSLTTNLLQVLNTTNQEVKDLSLPSDEGALGFFWSPDSQWISYVTTKLHTQDYNAYVTKPGSTERWNIGGGLQVASIPRWRPVSSGSSATPSGTAPFSWPALVRQVTSNPIATIRQNAGTLAIASILIAIIAIGLLAIAGRLALPLLSRFFQGAAEVAEIGGTAEAALGRIEIGQAVNVPLSDTLEITGEEAIANQYKQQLLKDFSWEGADWVFDSFASGYRVEILEEDLTAYRYYGGESNAQGAYLTDELQASPIEDLALPPENTATNMKEWKIPKGTTIVRGKAAPNFGNPGGGDQIFMPNYRILR